MNKIRQRLVWAGQIGSWLLSAFGGFYRSIAPPEDALRFWPSYCCVVAAVAYFLVSSLQKKTRSIIFLFSLLPTVVFPIAYYTEYQALTAIYGSSRVLCGTQYTQKGQDYASKHPEKDKAELVMDFAGQTGEIWTEGSIKHAGLILGLTYSAGFGSLAFTVLCAFERAKRSGRGP